MPLVRDDRFYNSSDDVPESILIHTIPSFIQSLIGQKKRFPANAQEWCVSSPVEDQSAELKITWIGHSTFLIQVGGFNLLTDPIFGHPSFLFPRMLPAGISLEQLPRIDAIVVSHNHQDHLDLPSLEPFDNVPLLVPQGDKEWLRKKGFVKTQEFMWWESTTFTSNHEGTEYQITCTFLPAVHWSARGLFDKNKSLWGSWMISCNGQHVYFAGDTAFGSHFQAIGQEYNHITVALLPIAPCKPSPGMLKSHMDVTQSVQAFIDLKAERFIPMHWGTFAFGVDYFEEPIIALRQLWRTHAPDLDAKELAILRAGEHCTIPPLSITPQIPEVQTPVQL